MLLQCLVDVTMGVFHGYQIALELSSFSPLKKKQELRRLITSNDGVISFIVTKKVNDADHFLSEFLVCLHCVWPITLEGDRTKWYRTKWHGQDGIRTKWYGTKW